MVLETNALAWKSGVEQMSFTAENLAYFQYERTIFPEVFSLSVTDQTLRLENISENDVSGDVYVYYKNMEEDVFIGGITYRVKFSEGFGQVKLWQSSESLSERQEVRYYLLHMDNKIYYEIARIVLEVNLPKGIVIEPMEPYCIYRVEKRHQIFF